MTNNQSKPSQEIIPIKEIRDGIFILKDGSLRMALMTSALNFALKSSNEQTAIVMQYQNFLNSLDFPIQIFIQSRDLYIGPYLETLREREKEQANELLKIQMREYIEFVKEFVKATNIVSKNFYVIVPYTPSIIETKKNPIFDLFGGFFGKKSSKKEASDQIFEEHKIQLQQRTDSVAQGLSRIGVRAAPLNTEELIELFYKIYNPSETENVNIPQYGPI